MSEEPNLVCVVTCHGLDVANILMSKLQAAEIPALLQYESAGHLFGLTVDGLGQVRIMVPEVFATEAEALLQEIPDDQMLDDEPLDSTGDE
jgi:hypothetical protein